MSCVIYTTQQLLVECRLQLFPQDEENNRVHFFKKDLGGYPIYLIMLSQNNYYDEVQDNILLEDMDNSVLYILMKERTILQEKIQQVLDNLGCKTLPPSYQSVKKNIQIFLGVVLWDSSTKILIQHVFYFKGGGGITVLEYWYLNKRNNRKIILENSPLQNCLDRSFDTQNIA